MNSRHALERQWAALIVRAPASRHILLKYLQAFGIEGYWVQFEDPQAALIIRAVQLLVYRNERVTADAVASHLAAYDFNLTHREARAVVDALLAEQPTDVDADRLALAVLEAQGVALPEHTITDYLRDPYGQRAQAMLAKKTRAAR